MKRTLKLTLLATTALFASTAILAKPWPKTINLLNETNCIVNIDNAGHASTSIGPGVTLNSYEGLHPPPIVYSTLHVGETKPVFVTPEGGDGNGVLLGPPPAPTPDNTTLNWYHPNDKIILTYIVSYNSDCTAASPCYVTKPAPSPCDSPAKNSMISE
jgi:hypothetical protein